MHPRYECTEAIIGQAMVLNEILSGHLFDLQEHLRFMGVSPEKIGFLQTMANEIALNYDKYLYKVEDIIRGQ